MQPFTLQELADRSGGQLIQGDPKQIVTGGVSTDTRAIKSGAEKAFFALKGDNFDAHACLPQLATAGADASRVVVVSNLSAAQAALPLPVGIVLVDDTLTALQKFAGDYRRRLPVRTVGVTGSSGKTSTKEMIAAVLGQKFRTQATKGNLNNHIGVPLTLLSLEPQDGWAVIEMGMNHPGEIAPLAAMAAPEAGVITMIGTAHIEHFKTDGQEGIAREKGALLAALPATGAAIFHVSEDFAPTLKNLTLARIIGVSATGSSEHAEWSARDIAINAEGIGFTLVHGDESHAVQLPALYSRPMVSNALLAAAVGGYAGLTIAEIARGLNSVVLPGQRMEVQKLGSRWIINDAYNANVDSMIAAVRSLREFPSAGRKIAILGSMGELGHRADEFHRRVGEEAARQNLDQLLVLGPGAEAMRTGALAAGMADQKIVICHDAAAAISALEKTFSAPGDCVLVKGSRFMRMEQIVALLSGAPVTASAH